MSYSYHSGSKILSEHSVLRLLAEPKLSRVNLAPRAICFPDEVVGKTVDIMPLPFLEDV